MPKTPPAETEDYVVVDGSDGPRRDVALFTGEAVHAYLGHLPDVALNPE